MKQRDGDTKVKVKFSSRKLTHFVMAKKSDQKTNNTLQNTTQKTNDCATRTPTNFGCDLMFLEG